MIIVQIKGEKRHKAFSLLLIAQVLLGGQGEAEVAQVQQTSVSQMNTEVLFPEQQTRILGFSSRDDAILVGQTHNKSSEGFLLNWNVSANKKNSKIALMKWISAFPIKLSADGQSLITDNVHDTQYFPHAKGYRITEINSSNFKSTWNKGLSSSESSGDFLTVGGTRNTFVSKIISMVPYNNSSDSSGCNDSIVLE